jgi:hypothetical protein
VPHNFSRQRVDLWCSGSKMASFGGDALYSIMFGPDICGYSTI